jgi:4-amino-4-deoxy-L-arabinose transferase-like glycosyltransferase
MSGRTSDGTTRVPFLTKHVSIAILAVVYLSFALTFSLLTRAYEADDEQAHTQYIEYILRHDALPHISAANLQESHQPPLYYLLTAAWQKLLAIPVFTPVVVQEHYKNPFIHDRLMLSHNYTATQHQDAVYLHELRLLSVLLGLGTVLLSYAAAKVAWMRESVALSVGLFVALLPRELVVSSSVTNDALVIPLCALALVMFLFSERARASARQRHRRLYVLGMGAALGAAAATKFNSLPVAAVQEKLGLPAA